MVKSASWKDVYLDPWPNVATAMQGSSRVAFESKPSAAFVRFAQWNNKLSERELQYCADDAYACVHLFHALNAQRKKMNPTPDLPPSADSKVPFYLSKQKRVISTETSEASDESVRDTASDSEDSAIFDEALPRQLPHRQARPNHRALRGPYQGLELRRRE